MVVQRGEGKEELRDTQLRRGGSLREVGSMDLVLVSLAAVQTCFCQFASNMNKMVDPTSPVLRLLTTPCARRLCYWEGVRRGICKLEVFHTRQYILKTAKLFFYVCNKYF